MNRFILFILFSIIRFSAFSQDSRIINVSFSPIINNEVVKVNNEMIDDTAQHVKINISKLKFYVSHLSFFKNETLVWKDNAQAHLLDAENDMSLRFTLSNNIHFNKIQFGLGIDSITNVSGALDGDLDPLKGMYWSWQSGYVNVKLEGNYFYNNAEKKFEFHLGGYSGENNAFNWVSLPVKDSSKISITLQLNRFFSDEMVSAHSTIMSPGTLAVEFAKIFSDCFTLP